MIQNVFKGESGETQFKKFAPIYFKKYKGYEVSGHKESSDVERNDWRLKINGETTLVEIKDRFEIYPDILIEQSKIDELSKETDNIMVFNFTDGGVAVVNLKGVDLDKYKGFRDMQKSSVNKNKVRTPVYIFPFNDNELDIDLFPKVMGDNEETLWNVSYHRPDEYKHRYILQKIN